MIFKIKGCIIFFLFISFSVFSQKDTVHSVPLTDIIESFSNFSGIQFAYNPNHFSEIEVASAEVDLNDLEYFKQILEDQGIIYKLVNTERWLLKPSKSDINSEQKGTILKGYVREGNEEPLVGALIFTSDGAYGSLTDVSGYFQLDIPMVSEFEVCCQFLGYEVQCLKNSEILSSKLEFDLIPKSVEIDQVTIKAKRLQFTIEPISDSENLVLSGSGINNAALGKDVLRSVQMLSGVDATNDLNSALSIRSSSQFQSLITLDGIPVYNPESAFGIFSALNPLVVQSTELYKNAMPLEYGEFTGAYLACEGLRNQKDKVNLDIELNTLKTAAAIQVPITKNIQISAAARSANGKISNEQFYSKISRSRKETPQSFQLFNRPLLVDSELENSFGDIYLNFIASTKRNETISLSFFGNRDESGTTFSDNYSFQRNNSAIRVDESYTQLRTKRNGGLSLIYNKNFDSGDKITFQMYTSRYELQDEIEAVIEFSGNGMKKPNSYKSTIFNTIEDSDIKFQYESDRKKLFSLKAGVDLRRINSTFAFKSNSESPLGQNKVIPSLTPYLGLRMNIKDRFIIDAGSRTSIIADGKLKAYLSPRINAVVKLNESFYFKSSFSHNEQYFRPIEIERQLGQSVAINLLANPNVIPILVSNQYTIGLNYKNENFRLNGDIFLRKNDGIVEQILNIPGLNNEDDVFGNNAYKRVVGENKVNGLELSSSYTYKNYSFFGSYTYSNSLDRFKALFNNKYINDQNNRLHQLNLLSTYEFKNWTFSSTYIYGSGVYTLNREGLGNNQDRPSVDPNSLFKQLPDYSRLDFHLSKEINTRYGDFHFDFGIFNLFNNKNINSEIYIYRLESANSAGLGAVEVNLLNRIWTMGIRYGL